MNQKMVRGYHRLQTKLRGEAHDAMFSVGLYHPEGGCDFEFTVAFGTFKNTGCSDQNYCKITLFGDSLRAVVLWPQLFAGIETLRGAQGQEPTQEQFLWLLNGLGFADLTEPEPAPVVALSDVQVEKDLWDVFLAECARQEVTPSEYLPGIISEHLAYLNTMKG